MMRRRFAWRILLAAALSVLLLLPSCKDVDITREVKVGLVLAAQGDEYSAYNECVWEGIRKAAQTYNIKAKSILPESSTETDCIAAIGSLYEQGVKLIILPGVSFEKVAYQAQERYKDIKFILVGGVPHGGDYNALVGRNTVALYFNESEEGFIAGLAAAVRLPGGRFGVIANKTASPYDYVSGFIQGVRYANENFACSAKLMFEDFYLLKKGELSTFETEKLALELFAKREVIFSYGSTADAVIEASLSRARLGIRNLIVTAGTDKYDSGIYKDSAKSVVITSGMRRIADVVFDLVEDEVYDIFPGGQVRTCSIANGGIALPDINPNLDDEDIACVKLAVSRIREGSLTVRLTVDDWPSAN